MRRMTALGLAAGPAACGQGPVAGDESPSLQAATPAPEPEPEPEVFFADPPPSGVNGRPGDDRDEDVFGAGDAQFAALQQALALAT